MQALSDCSGAVIGMCVRVCSAALEHLVLYGCVISLSADHSYTHHHNICHSKANMTFTTSRLRAISSRIQCCCHSWFSFL